MAATTDSSICNVEHHHRHIRTHSRDGGAHIPATLSRLTRLCVLKGFFVGETDNDEEDSCTLQDLSSLRFLVKLNIHTSLKTFPSENHLTLLEGFKFLRNLTICWGGCPGRNENPRSRPKKSPAIHFKRFVRRDSDPVVEVQKFSFNLEKLDLRGAPETGTPNWLQPSKFEKLEKLYIRGGQLSDLRLKPSNFEKLEKLYIRGGRLSDLRLKESQKDKQLADLKEKGWSVKLLRLRHLSKLRMDWSEVQNSFPNVVSLEKVECPNLTSFPCDDDGLWTKDTTQPPATTSFLK